jgi:RNA polymerase sigma-70 factor (ECF subfamily)
LRGRYRYDAAIKRLPRPDIEYPPDEPDERAAGLWAAIGALDEDDREILMLREFEELSYQEIADLRRLPLNTVRTKLFRARMALKAALRPEQAPLRTHQ